ncbi:MAG TPA: hypothetical protein VGD42_23240, partial [Lysobacter sp.]
LLMLMLMLMWTLPCARRAHQAPSPEGRRTGCAAVSAEPWMANRERALALSGRGIGLDLKDPFFLVTFFFGSAKKK